LSKRNENNISRKTSAGASQVVAGARRHRKDAVQSFPDSGFLSGFLREASTKGGKIQFNLSLAPKRVREKF
jgi:hypothetical protein